jgi:hypothetical protein
MNALEQEWDDSVRRAALEERRREDRVLGIGVVWACCGYEGVTSIAHGDVGGGACALGVMAVLALGVYAAAPLARRVAAWSCDRHTVVTSTKRERELGCREATLRPDESKVAARRWLRRLGKVVVPLGVYAILWHVDWVFDGSTRTERLVNYGLVAGVAALGWGLEPACAFWRKRRDARRAAEWARRVANREREHERWLASADTCEVRPREWTK